MASYNRTRYVEALLEKTEPLPPSFTVHLHLEYWTLNNGSKFLYNNQIASLLDDVRAHRIPVDFLDLFEAAKVPFYDGCMVVELLDYRPQRDKEPTPEKPERTRAVLHPNSETLWADICSLNQRYGGKWTDKEALEIEARLVLATSPPLCLDPDPHLTRIANHVLRVSTPTVPVSLKRKASAMNSEEDETDKARRAKIMQFMNPRQNRTYNPSYRILDVIQNARQKAAGGQPTQVNGQFVSNAVPSTSKPPTPSINVSQAQSPVEDDKKVNGKKAVTPQMQFAATAFIRANRSQTPIPPQNTHTFISHNASNPSPSPSSHSPMQPQVYPNVQAATEAAKRTPTPAQIKQYSQSPRPPQSHTPALQHPPQQSTQVPHNIPQPQITPFPPQGPNSHFLSSTPARSGVSKASPPNNTPRPTSQQQASYAQHLLYAQQQQQAAHLQQRLKNGRTTPQVATGAGQSTPSPARNSPMVTNKALAARSPMPPATQLPGQQPQLQQQSQQQAMAQHPPQHPHRAFTPQYNPAHLRPLVHGNPQLPAHMTAALQQQQQQTHTTVPVAGTSDSQQQPPQQQQQQTQAQIQQQMHMYQMYGYSAMNYGQMQAAHTQRLYWQQQQQQQQGMGRGMPMTGVQQPGMPAQQVVGKAGGAGIQGR